MDQNLSKVHIDSPSFKLLKLKKLLRRKYRVLLIGAKRKKEKNKNRENKNKNYKIQKLS